MLALKTGGGVFLRYVLPSLSLFTHIEVLEWLYLADVDYRAERIEGKVGFAIEELCEVGFNFRGLL